VRKKEVEKALRLLASEAPEKVINDLSVSLVKKLYHPLRKSQVVIQGGEND
jgi:glutamyl-tRNA reductase